MTSKFSSGISKYGFSKGVACVHPQLDDDGKQVTILRSSTPSSLSTWSDPDCSAAVIPDGDMPFVLNGVPFQTWKDPPSRAQDWEVLAQASTVDEPAFDPPEGLASAAGVVIQEPDGRIWLVCPTNQFGGYEITFPKGRTDGKSLQATAVTEAFEECGLRVRLLRHLVDVKRSTTYTRYYLAERVGGTPAAMGWESQCVLLTPRSLLGTLRLLTPDTSVVQALTTLSNPQH
ncbi:NUDIX hydrolase [Hydrogenophaga sp. BPS33]|uniref:NUDIX hydrolase n=1 Tax=Hydrogenophaga sp. BPS33 TaxID=2651974 RepID=UPI0013204671|nr:NUDIX hydrolase [Hydrogenophaga sp. BPS33]QHE84732.1 NUDIX hydrolase [Hydrogenophaga sp. BPS33]